VPVKPKGSKGKKPMIRDKIAAATEVLNKSGAISNEHGTRRERLPEDSVATEPRAVDSKRKSLKRHGAMVLDHNMGGSKRSRNKVSVT
jgi:hypothetical protein